VSGPGAALERLPRLGPQDGRRLVRLARAAIRDAVVGDGAVARDLAALDPGPELSTPRGAFVTLRRPDLPDPTDPHGALRGCVGSVDPELPLYRHVVELAPRAALHDPRFPPLARGELPVVHVHVSVLGPLREIDGPAAIEIGRHGVEMTAGGRRAVFLPEVAPAQGWDARRLLAALARKGGIEAARVGAARLRVFETVQFDEDDTVAAGGRNTSRYW